MALGSVVVNSWVDVEVTEVCVIVEVTFGRAGIGAVSYTHLTLPTILLV